MFSVSHSSAEPAIPWDAHLYPDGTPVSLTEAAALRNLTTGVDEFLYLNTSLAFNPANWQDSYITVVGGGQVILWAAGLKTPMTDGVAEAAIWVQDGGETAGMILRQGWTVKSSFAGYYVGVNVRTKMLTVERWTPNISPVLGSYDLSKRENGLIMNGWNLLRVAIVGNVTTVWFNPSYPDSVTPETGKPRRIEPLIICKDDDPRDPEQIASGDLALVAVGADMKADYISLLPLSVLPPQSLDF